jgi:curved DNA-binding protein CbpA
LEVFLTLFDEEKLNHYQTLGVEKTAGDEEIKRAYFRMVRKFQPGSFPEKFKEIRTAYETLKDKQKRVEYDAVGELPGSMAPLFNEAQWFDHLGRHSKAAELYQIILKRHPELDNVREQYAKSLTQDQKTGKAAEVWEELCQRYPSNARYSEELAECYSDRGWHKKAAAELKRTIALDSSSLDAWSLVMYCIVEKMHNAPDRDVVFDELKTSAQEAIKAVNEVKENEWKKINLYAYAFITSSDKDHRITEGYLEEIARLIREGGRGGQQNGMNALVTILDSVPNYNLGVFYSEIKKIAELLPELTVERKTRPNPVNVRIENIRINYEIENLEKKGFSEVFRDLFRVLKADFEEEDDEVEIAAMEYEILDNKSTFDPQLRRLREEFPELYALHSSFFNEALRTRDPEKMLYQRGKKVNKYHRRTGFFEEHPESAPEQPVRRAEPKIGRNDPCPCGSGKKYKKCCGA